MRRPVLIIVSGPPASGKSRVARSLCSHLGFAVVAKDDIKERMFDAEEIVSAGDRRDLSRRACIAALGQVAERLVRGESVILEGNWRAADHGAAIARLVSGHRPAVLQVQCVGAGEPLLERFVARARAGLRHPAHSDLDALPRLRDELLRGRYDPLPLPGPLLEIDTTADDEGEPSIAVAVALAQR